MAITKIQSESLNLADTYAFTGTVTGAGGNNKPAFVAEMRTAQSFPHNAWTICSYETEKLDTDGTYNSSTYTWTPGVVGWYCIAASLSMAKSGGTSYNAMQLRKNGSSTIGTQNCEGKNAVYPGQYFYWVFEVTDTSDYFNVRAYQDSGASITVDTASTEPRCVLYGFKLIT